MNNPLMLSITEKGHLANSLDPVEQIRRVFDDNKGIILLISP